MPDDRTSVPADLASCFLAGLVPWATFLTIMVATGGISGFGAGAAVSFLFVALPSTAPIGAVRRGPARVAITLLMTAVAAFAARAIITTDDAQAGLAVFLVPMVAVPLAIALWLAGQIVLRRADTRPARGAAPVLAEASDRAAALVIDVLALFAVLVVPLTMLSHRKYEIVAIVIGLTVAAAYFAGTTLSRGRTLGQSVLRLRVVDVDTAGALSAPVAVLRSVAIVAELAGTLSFVLAPVALVDLLVVSASGRSLVDRVLRTSVVHAP